MKAKASPSLKDPRIGSNFLPHFLPLSDCGDPPPPDAPGRNDQVRLEFLAAYYELNTAYAQLLLDQQKDRAPTESARASRKIERLLRLRDHLEDRYAPLGVIAEATFAKGFAVNITFTFPDESRWVREQQGATAREAELRFPLPGNRRNCIQC
jgi:hypothetical protein